MSDLLCGASRKNLSRAGIAVALTSAWLLMAPLSRAARAATIPVQTGRTGTAAAASPPAAAIPALTLMRELTALRDLARLELTPAQRKVVSGFLPHPEAWPGAPLGPLAAAEQVNHLLRQERNAILAGQSLPAGFCARLDAETAVEDSWDADQKQAIERAVEALLPSLSADQRSELLKPEPTISQFQMARTLVIRARQPGAAEQRQLTARLEKRWPAAAATIADSLKRVPAMAPDQFVRERDALTLRIANLIASLTPAPRETDASAATALETMLSYPAIEAALSPGALELRNLREALRSERHNLEEQIRTIRILLSLGFTRTQIRAAESSLQQADELRDLQDAESRKIRARLADAVAGAEVDLASPTVTPGKSLPAPVDEPVFLEAFQFQTQNISADDQLAAMAILNAAPSDRAAPIAASYVAIERAEQIEVVLQQARRAYTVSEFLARQDTLAAEIMRYLKASEGIKAQVEAALGRARLMTDEEFAVRLPALTREIIALGAPPAAPATPPATPAKTAAPMTAAQKSAALEAAEQIQNTAAERLGPLLDVAGLSDALQ